jgi:1,4-alpha-glucan branching enzyme
MRPRGATGIWELFIPNLGEWELYKYQIRSSHQGYTVEKADPVGFASELRPKTASLVFDVDRYSWGDDEWMDSRKTINSLDAPISIYEVHLGSWRRSSEGHWLTYRDLAEELVAYVKEMGYTHIELLPITEPDVLYRSMPPSRHRCHLGLGTGSLSQGRDRAGLFRRHPSLRAR